MSRTPLTHHERAVLHRFVSAVEILTLDLTPEEVGKLADHVGEHGTGGGGGAREDDAELEAVVLECLRLVVDAVSR